MRCALAIALAAACLCASPHAARAQSGGGFELLWSGIDGGGETSAGGEYEIAGTIGQPDAGAAMSGGEFAAVGGVWPAGVSPTLDVDVSGSVDVGTDVVYVARRLLGLPAVPPSFRDLDPTIPPDAEIAARIDALGSALDVDADGSVNVGTDVVYIVRYLLGLPPVPQSFRDLDPTIPPDAEIGARIALLVP